MLEELKYVLFHMESAGCKIVGAHAMEERNWDAERSRYTPMNDTDMPPHITTRRWRGAESVVWFANHYRKTSSRKLPTFEVEE
jgi:hypothetical protein